MILNMERPIEFQNPEAIDRISDLVRMVQKGHRDAFGMLYEEYSSRVYRYATCIPGRWNSPRTSARKFSSGH